MFKILDITSLRSIFFVIILDLKHAIQTQLFYFILYIYIYVSAKKWTEVDTSGQNMTKWEQGGPSRTK